MPLPIPAPSPPGPDPEPSLPSAVAAPPASRALPFWQRQPERWAEAEVRDSHHEALMLLGEYAMFVLMWHPADEAAGLVERCSRCYAGTAMARAGAVYRQPSQAKCPVCYGTTFEGGYRARIIRPSLWSDSGTDTVRHPRGEVRTDSMTVETTEDFVLRHGDYAFRADGTRHQALELTGAWVRTGMAQPGLDRSVGGAIAQVRMEDPTSVAYTIPPTSTADLVEALALPARMHLPPDLSARGGYADVYRDLYAYYERAGLEDVRGPLLVPVLPGGATGGPA